MSIRSLELLPATMEVISKGPSPSLMPYRFSFLGRGRREEGILVLADILRAPFFSTGCRTLHTPPPLVLLLGSLRSNQKCWNCESRGSDQQEPQTICEPGLFTLHRENTGEGSTVMCSEQPRHGDGSATLLHHPEIS